MNLRSKEITFIHNDTQKLRSFLKDEPLLCGWNNKWYDDWILLALLKGADNSILKDINDWIIGGQYAWEHFFLTYTKKYPYTMDLRNDVYQGVGLKDLEGNLGMSVQESSVPFDIDRKLTKEELEEVKGYNIHDVKATYELFKIRKGYLQNKLEVGKMIGIPQSEALGLTNAKLSAKFLGAKKRTWHDERELDLPKNLDYHFIPNELIDFFEETENEEIPNDEFFRRKLILEFDGVEYVYAYGGVHAGIPNYQKPKNKSVFISDVRSLYPSLMIEYDLLSRNVPNLELFERIYYERVEAKHNENWGMSEALKLILNTTYGAMLNKYNDLYDPKMGRHVCIYGQLFLSELLFRLRDECSSFKMINFNTDGIMYELDKKDYRTAKRIITEWETRTRFVLETDKVDNVIQKDVNNYIALINGKVKTAGSVVKNYGGGNFESNSISITADAVVDYFLYGTPIADTINNCEDILKFQFIAKTGRSYLKTYYGKYVDGEEIKDNQEVQRVNRVYASKDKTLGSIYKYKLVSNKDDEIVDRFDKIANIPKHCVIDNDNKLSIKDIDKEWYISYTENRIKQYLGG